MAQFIEGLDRQQSMLLPERLDDYVDENSPVGVIDAFADILDLAALGFDTQPAAPGRPVIIRADAADLPLRLSEPGPVIATVGT